MKATDRDAMTAHLIALGVAEGRNLVVHSSLAAFGLLQGGMGMLLDCLRDCIGPAATLAVPTYRLSAPVDEVFDRSSSLSLKVGAFSEFVRQIPGAVRSANPLHSHAFMGPLSRGFERDVVRPSFGPGSDFDFFVKEDFLCLCLGCDLENAGTFVFHAQAVADNIPYRAWQNLTRTCSDLLNGQAPQPCSFGYYARVDGAPREQRKTLEAQMGAAGQLKLAKAVYGKSIAFDCRSACAFMVDAFRRDPMLCALDRTAQA